MQIGYIEQDICWYLGYAISFGQSFHHIGHSSVPNLCSLSERICILHKLKLKIMKKIAILFLFFALVIVSQKADAQTKTFNFSVTDKEGEPIIGASVVVVGSSVSTVTNFNGFASFGLPWPFSTIVKVRISYLGYKTQEITLSSVTSISIVLIEDDSSNLRSRPLK